MGAGLPGGEVGEEVDERVDDDVLGEVVGEVEAVSKECVVRETASKLMPVEWTGMSLAKDAVLRSGRYREAWWRSASPWA